jgi:mRNA interferase MazF
MISKKKVYTLEMLRKKERMTKPPKKSNPPPGLSKNIDQPLQSPGRGMRFPKKGIMLSDLRKNSRPTKFVKQFEVYVVDLGQTMGSEIKKARPSVIISPNAMNRHLDTILICPLTHTIKKYPTRVQSEFQQERGEVVLDQLRAVDKNRLVKKIGMMDEKTAGKIKKALVRMFA